MEILLTCGYNNSRHSLAVLELMRRKDIKVQKCVIINAFSVNRLKYYFKQLDFKEFKKKAIDRIFSNLVSSKKLSDEIKYVNTFLQEKEIDCLSISDYCKKNNISFIKAHSLSESSVISFIENVDLVIYTGGGIIKKNFLEKINIGVLNCHAGKLPEIRGTNSGEWSIFLNIPLANSLNFMVRKIDMGPILNIIQKDYSECETIDQIRGKAINYTITDLVNTTLDIIKGNYRLIEQKPEEGKQYYTMHPILKNITNQMLKRVK